jgi:hypothetical protein
MWENRKGFSYKKLEGDVGKQKVFSYKMLEGA